MPLRLSAVVILLLAACSDPAAPRPDPAVPGKPDIVLVSLDTARADAIDAETTPNLWALAATGVRFEQAWAHAPTTLSSHASVMTGLDPHGHAVPRNGYALTTRAPMLAGRLAEAGYDTIGVIGSSALAEPMGIEVGFRLWDQRLTRKHEQRHEARAAGVTDRAFERLGQRAPGKPLLLFVHYFDAHAPYDAPAPYTTRWVDSTYHGPFDGTPLAMRALADASREGSALGADVAAARGRYRGELSYLDAELGRLLSRLDRPVVVVFGDHGEALGDLGERAWGHGADVDPVATHVPLIVAGPGIAPAVEGTPVALSDIGATVLALAGVEGGLGKGRDLTALWRGGAWEDRPIFLEATQPEQAESRPAWNNLRMERGVRQGEWLWMRTPWQALEPVLVRVAGGERVDGDDVGDDLGVGERLDAALTAWDAGAPPWRPERMDADTQEGLRALGYVE